MPKIGASAASHKRPSQQYPSTGWMGLSSGVDRMLAASGVTIALSSLAFAGYMVADVDRPPRIAGMEYLSVFARPSHSVIVAAQSSAPAVVATASNLTAQSIDTTPTGSIPARIDLTPTGSIPDKVVSSRSVDFIAPQTRVVDLKVPPSRYKLLDVSNGEALIQSDIGFRHVKIGDVLPDLGRVNAIEKQGDHWVLSTQNGAPLEWPAPSPATPETIAPKKKTSPH
jgi:hypothetical protein